MTIPSQPGNYTPQADRSTVPLGPESLTWKLFGDMRFALVAGRTATLQAMHPGVGAVLWDSSRFRWELADRLWRSVPPILGVIYDEPKQSTGRTVRDFHKGMKGTDTTGRHWHALKPELFYWVHATFVESMVAAQQHFGTPLTPSEKDQLIAESPAYWATYGVRAPQEHWADWADFEHYWNTTMENELERNRTTDFALHTRDALRPPPTNVPALLWSAVHRPAHASLSWVTNGVMSPQEREILGLRWAQRDRLAFAATSAVVRQAWKLVPEDRGYFPRAAAGIARARMQSN